MPPVNSHQATYTDWPSDTYHRSACWNGMITLWCTLFPDATALGRGTRCILYRDPTGTSGCAIRHHLYTAASIVRSLGIMEGLIVRVGTMIRSSCHHSHLRTLVRSKFTVYVRAGDGQSYLCISASASDHWKTCG